MKWRASAPWPLLAVSPLLLLWPPLRHLLEGQMTLHMLLQFPWLLTCGAAAFGALGRNGRAARLLARVDDRGLFTVTLLLCVSALWMIPAALDLALLDHRVRLAKYLTWYAAGLVLAGGGTRLGPELWAFLLGNLAWMLATAGWLIRESDTRLCVSYLARDQYWAGTGLVALAFSLAAWGLLNSGIIARGHASRGSAGGVSPGEGGPPRDDRSPSMAWPAR
jgi:hypothetical protein